jgi:hypothetical protein
MKHELISGGTRLHVRISFTEQEVAAFPHAACPEGIDVTLDLPQLGGMVAAAIRSKHGKSVDAGGALVVRRAKAKS